MLVKLKFPLTIAGAMPEQFSRLARPAVFGIAAAKALRHGSAVFAANAPEESFGQKIKKAVEQKSGVTPTQKQHKEQAERESNRYLHKPRQRTKGE
jgi:hypothetical protein